MQTWVAAQRIRHACRSVSQWSLCEDNLQQEFKLAWSVHVLRIGHAAPCLPRQSSLNSRRLVIRRCLLWQPTRVPAVISDVTCNFRCVAYETLTDWIQLMSSEKEGTSAPPETDFVCGIEASALLNCVASKQYTEAKCKPLLQKLRACIEKKVCMFRSRTIMHP